ncbi:MAG: ATP-dependent Clp protease proteolytic subunit [Erysipelotrichaceae bacterium]
MVIIPTIIERNASVERVYDLYSCLLKERIIILTGEINDQMASSICAQLLYLDSIAHDDILLYINSPGGSVASGLAILDTMNYVLSSISTVGMGLCASMAAILLCSGAKEKRFCLENCEVMIHQPLGEISGQAIDMELAATHITKIKQRLYKILSIQCNQELKIIEHDCDRDNYMDSLEAKQYGLIDDIIKNK